MFTFNDEFLSLTQQEQRKNEEEEETNEGCRVQGECSNWQQQTHFFFNSKLIVPILIFDRQATVALRSNGIPNRQSFTAIAITSRYIDGSFRLCISQLIKNEAKARLSYLIFYSSTSCILTLQELA